MKIEAHPAKSQGRCQASAEQELGWPTRWLRTIGKAPQSTRRPTEPRAPKSAGDPHERGIKHKPRGGVFLPVPPGVPWSPRTRPARPGETVLIHAAAGGVGSAAVQLAVAAGARVIATVGNDDKAALVEGLGADVVINYRTEDFVGRVPTLPPAPVSTSASTGSADRQRCSP